MKTNQSPAQTPNDLLSDLHALVADAEQMIASSATDAAPEAVSALQARFAAAQEKLSTLYAGAKQRVVAGAKCTDSAIRENPYQAMAIAAGVALLVGVLVGRRSNS